MEKAKRAKEEAEDSGFADITLYDDARKLAEDLLNERIDAAVRGDIDSNRAMGAVRKAFQVPKVLRSAFMQPRDGRMFLLAPVGIDEGWTIAEKVEIARLSVRLMRRLDMEPKVGFMSGGRASDKGRMAEIDRSIETADIAYFYSDEKITFMMTREGQHLPIDFSLDKLVTLLDPKQFFRANRQFLVGFEAIENVFTHFKGKLKLELAPKNKHEVFVSGDRMTDFKEWLGK
ncbi:MAG TPA: LytTR family transcriptional regulator DNA-binding domain-containing protein [Methanomassiliicoccaceae archaeon]|nr:LytTR family transcriptional regulator DNA-binding domain-containing protein [Methanomassiliicoccaceae archaeon]